MAAPTKPLAVGIGAALALAAGLVTIYEGYRSEPYRDVIGVLTVCYGHTGGVEDREYTPAECERLMHEDLREAHAAVKRCIGVSMTPGQEAALTDAAYNIGPAVVCGSTLQRLALAGDWPGACAQLSRWVYAGGRELPGLVKRRAAERALCEGRQ